MGGIGILGGIASSIMSGIRSKEAIAAANADYQERRDFLDNTFNKLYYQDITKRTDVQNMMRLLQENQDKQAKRDEAVAAITGATTESQLAAQDSRNKSYADALAEIASNASQLKDSYLQNYQQQRLGLVNPRASLLQQESNMWGQAGSNLFSSGASLFGSGMDGLIGSKSGGAKPQKNPNSSTQPSYFGAFNPQPIN